MGCGKSWEDNLAEALAAGAIPDFEPEEQPVASPFAGANMAPSGSDWTCKMASPFAVTPSFAALPKDIQDLVDERFKSDFILVLDPSKKELDKKKVLDVMDAYSSKGNKSAIQFLEALAKAKPLVPHLSHCLLWSGTQTQQQPRPRMRAPSSKRCKLGESGATSWQKTKRRNREQLICLPPRRSACFNSWTSCKPTSKPLRTSTSPSKWSWLRLIGCLGRRPSEFKRWSSNELLCLLGSQRIGKS